MGNQNKFVTAIILAAGSGRRMNSSVQSRILKFLGKVSFRGALRPFLNVNLYRQSLSLHGKRMLKI